MKRNFEQWIEKLEESIASWKYYTDFDKVYHHVNQFKKELDLLNSLMGSKQIEKDFKQLIENYPNVLKAVPILIAKRGNEIVIKEAGQDYHYQFQKKNYSIEEYAKFMRKTGIFDLLESHLIGNVYDYVMGIEVGLDSNGRKNRTGHAMEDLVESYIVKAGFVKNESYFKELTTAKIKQKWNIDLTVINQKLQKAQTDKKAEKRFDFVVKTKSQLYVIETNFYSGGGSKLNETARSYKMMQEEIEKVQEVTFVWFTDGKGWLSAKNNLKETFDVMEHIYHIADMKENIMEKVFQ